MWDKNLCYSSGQIKIMYHLLLAVFFVYNCSCHVGLRCTLVRHCNALLIVIDGCYNLDRFISIVGRQIRSITAAASKRHFIVGAYVLTLKRIILRGADISSQSGSLSYGGTVYIDGAGTLLATECIFQSNKATHGGAGTKNGAMVSSNTRI